MCLVCLGSFKLPLGDLSHLVTRFTSSTRSFAGRSPTYHQKLSKEYTFFCRDDVSESLRLTQLTHCKSPGNRGNIALAFQIWHRIVLTAMRVRNPELIELFKSSSVWPD